MMANKELVAVLCCLTLASAYVASTPEHCATLEAGWEEKLDDMLANLPEQVNLDSLEFPGYQTQLTIANIRQSLVSDGPYRTFCYGPDRVIVVKMRCGDQCLELTFEWAKSDGESSGEVFLSLSELELEARLLVTETGAGSVYNIVSFVPLHLKIGNLLIKAEGIELSREYIEGALRKILVDSFPRAFEKAAQFSGLLDNA